MNAHLQLVVGSLILSLSSVACVLDPASLDETEEARTSEPRGDTEAETTGEATSALNVEGHCVDGVYQAEGSEIVAYPNNQTVTYGGVTVYARPAKIEFTLSGTTISNAKVWCAPVDGGAPILRTTSPGLTSPGRWDITNMCVQGWASHRIAVHLDASNAYGAARRFEWQGGFSSCETSPRNINAFFAVNNGTGPMGTAPSYAEYTIPSIRRVSAAASCEDPTEGTVCGTNAKCCFAGPQMFCADVSQSKGQCPYL